ncbi:MAG: hypothetical protein KDA41_18910, partial [Planctomycetales bacterium]|nr:hypothetical protein [Planctomycetales bacterium]
TYFWDFLAVWLLFVVTFGVMRAVTDLLSSTQIKFKVYLEQPGRVIFGLAAGYVMVAFAAMTLHMAPIPERAFGGAFHNAVPSGGDPRHDKSLTGAFMGFAPDRQWLSFAQSLSRAGDDDHATGALARWTLGGWSQRTFDPDNRFIFKYGARRRALEQNNAETGTMRVIDGP